MGRMVTLLTRSLQSYRADKCAPLAAAIAYYTVFALFPLALLGLSLLGFFVSDETARRQVVDGIASGGIFGDDGKAALERTLAGVSSARGWLGLVGVLTAAWSVTGLFGVIRSALDSVWDVDRPLPLLRAKLRDLTLMVGVGGLLGASTASTGLLHGARQAGAHGLGPLLDLAGPVFGLLVFAVALLLTFTAFLVLYRVAPHARLGWGDVWPAAAIAALFFELGTNGLTYYIRNLGHVNALAGSLGGAILFLTFVYYTAQVILFAAEVTKHRMLVQAGAVPARDPASTTAPVPLGKKARGTLRRLWTVDLSHHDTELPYAPSRQAAATQQPTNTREEVLFKQHEARARDAQDAGQDDRAAMAGAGPPRRSAAVLHTGGKPSPPPASRRRRGAQSLGVLRCPRRRQAVANLDRAGRRDSRTQRRGRESVGATRTYTGVWGPDGPRRGPPIFGGARCPSRVCTNGSAASTLREWNATGRLSGLKFMRTLWICAATGGPFHYTGKGLGEAHEDLHITPAEFDEVGAEIARALDYYKVPERERQEVLTAIASKKSEVVTSSR